MTHASAWSREIFETVASQGQEIKLNIVVYETFADCD